MMTGPFSMLPEGRFRVIYADPPWSFKTWSPAGGGRAPDRHYPCMTLDDICALPVAAIAAPDAVLCLWVVQPLLPAALRVLAAWGFAYKTVAYYWIKTTAVGRPRKGLGYYTRSGAEQCWLATRGGGVSRVSKSEPQVVMAPAREHSRKPDGVAESIERLFGDVPRVELFARTRRPGWTAWGNQTEQFKIA